MDHLATLRDLLAAERLRRPSWDHALRDVAEMARVALQSESALVAVWGLGGWAARGADGQALDRGALHALGAVSTLEEVRRTGKPLLNAAVVAVPLAWWTLREGVPQPTFGGCLLVLRGDSTPPFERPHLALASDVALLAEPVLSLLRDRSELEEGLRTERAEADALRAVVAREYRLGRVSSLDPAFGERVLTRLRTLASASRVGLWLSGPLGSGKSSLARAYHLECPRRDGPFVTLDCARITDHEALAAALFGIAPDAGVFHAPPGGRVGKVQGAEGGTLVLDEAAALPDELQQRLLDVLRTGRPPIGHGRREAPVDVQVLTTSVELPETLVARGQLREDLYSRLAEMVVELPPLDRRVADIPALAGELLHGAAERAGKGHLVGFTEAARAALLRHPWSRYDNLRGLEQVVTRAVLLAPSEARRLDAEHLHFELWRGGVRPPVAPPRAPRVEPAPSEGAETGAPAVVWRAAGRRRGGLRRILEAKLREHAGDLDAIALDPELRAHSGHGDERIPQSTLYAWLRDLELRSVMKAQRRAQRQDRLAEITAAIRRHGTASAAARELGMPRSAVIWQLRRAGKTVADVCDDASGDG